MEIYDCKVLVGGSRSNEVRKEGIPAPEVILLRHIHGDDSVINVVHVGTSDISDADVRDMLALTYGPDAAETSKAGPKILQDVFGVRAIPLPKAVDDAEIVATAPKKIKPEKLKRLRDIRPEDQVMPASVALDATATAMFDE